MNGDGCQSFNPGISQAPEKPQFHHFVEHPAAILYVRDAIVPRRRGTPFQPICQSVPEPSWRAGGNRRFARVGLCGATPGHETLGMRMRTRIPGPIYELARLLALLSASWLTPIERLGPLARALRRLRERERDPSGATEIIMAHLLSDRASPRQASELLPAMAEPVAGNDAADPGTAPSWPGLAAPLSTCRESTPLPPPCAVARAPSCGSAISSTVRLSSPLRCARPGSLSHTSLGPSTASRFRPSGSAFSTRYGRRSRTVFSPSAS